jgi:hypothetical protein
MLRWNICAAARHAFACAPPRTECRFGMLPDTYRSIAELQALAGGIVNTPN